MIRYILFCICVIFFASFVGVTCVNDMWVADFSLEKVWKVNIYNNVIVIHGAEYGNGKFIFKEKKKKIINTDWVTFDDDIETQFDTVLNFSDIKYDFTDIKKDNDCAVEIFMLETGQFFTIIFENAHQAASYVLNGVMVLPDDYKIESATETIAYGNLFLHCIALDNDDISFDFVEAIENERASKFFFKRSEIEIPVKIEKDNYIVNISQPNELKEYILFFENMEELDRFMTLVPVKEE